ncbi:MAG TPA: class I SAM-dependent methyltransferase [Pyrinomonadaceae bacterium]|nr:class I SAM-dependent methyltransferase [Pyrinomonadaceae bacterium]
MRHDLREQLSPHQQCRQFLAAELAPGGLVLDVGCGTGNLMKELARMGYAVSGVEIDAALVEACRDDGLEVREGRAESLPFPDESVDAVVCSVVLPYTDERAAVKEWARVLRSGGVANASCHGLGYGVRYLIGGPGLKTRF